MKPEIPEWMRWDEKKSESVEPDEPEEEDGGIIEETVKHKPKFGRRCKQ